MYSFAINYWAVFGAGVAAMILGMVWYSSFFFGKVWMKSVGITTEDMKSMTRKSMVISYGATFVSALVTAFVLALFIQNLFVVGLSDVLKISFFTALGFVLAIQTSIYAFTPKNKSFSGFLVTTGYYFVLILLQGFIIYIFS